MMMERPGGEQDMLSLAQEEIEERLAVLEFTDRDVAVLTQVHAHLMKERHFLADSFYRHLQQFPALRRLLEPPGTLARLRKAQAAYFSELTEGDYGLAYVDRRLRIGVAHQRIGLEPQWYMGAYRKYLSELLPILHELSSAGIVEFVPAYDALMKVVCFDMSLALDTYIHAERLQVARLKNHDVLTSLPNRTLLQDRVTQAIAYARRAGRCVAILLIDLDRFKNINDSLGHEAGDMVIVETGRRLLAAIRSGDTVARLGGDEFAVALADVARVEDVALVAQKILESLLVPVEMNGQELSAAASIGISLYPRDGADCQALMKNADAALFRAKDAGRGHFQFYAQDMNARTLDRIKLEMSLRHALERNELVLHYQPVIESATGEMHGVEVLLRWQPCGGQLVPPADFIPIAEETGLIVPIGEWVLRMACEQQRRWREQGAGNFCVAINLSPRQFRHRDLHAVVERTLNATACPPEMIELEITESMLMEDPDAAIATLRRLSEMGVRLAIDDFGTGYSNLNYLKRFPIDTLKIDKSFVHDIATDPDDAAIAKAVIALAHSMKLKVTAEGVETCEQFDFLCGQKCDRMQGFYFSPPVPADELPMLCAARKKIFPGISKTGSIE